MTKKKKNRLEGKRKKHQMKGKMRKKGNIK